EESEDVPALLTTEAVVEAASRIQRQGRRLLLVERADRHVGATRPLDLGHRPDELHQIGGLSHLVDVVAGIGHVQMIRSRGDDPTRKARSAEYQTASSHQPARADAIASDRRSTETRSWVMVSR